MDTIYKYINEIMSIDSPTGYCDKIINYVESIVQNMGFKTSKTNKGNLIVEIGDGDNALGVCAHVDTLGLMVRSIKSNGTLAFTVLGGPILPTLDGEYCKVYTRDGKCYTGTIISNAPAVHVYENARSIERNEENMCIRLDEIVKSKEDVEKLGIQNGDIVAYDPKTIITPTGFVKSRFLDDKLSVAIILKILDDISKSKLNLKRKTYFLISTYEEVGHGMSWIPNDIGECLAVDMGCIGLDLSCSEYDVSICAKDSSGPYDYDLVSELIKIAKENNLSYAVDIYPRYSSDVSAALRGGNNVKGALIGAGVAASHGMERTHTKAIENTYMLLKKYLEQ